MFAKGERERLEKRVRKRHLSGFIVNSSEINSCYCVDRKLFSIEFFSVVVVTDPFKKFLENVSNEMSLKKKNQLAQSHLVC